MFKNNGLFYSCNWKIWIVMTLVILLCSCSSHVSRQDGPPDFYVDETKIPNAVPKPVKLSKYGNYSAYSVFGKRYYTLKSSKNYDEVGIASWYGKLYHAHPTSDGERYNMLGMTAAHKTLPLPTYVEVTNLRNQRKVIVKVNDRGPFEGNRLIDLSYVAAKKLDMIGHGTELVRVRAIDSEIYDRKKSFYIAEHHNRPTFQVASNQSRKQVYLQVGAFRNKQHAQKLRQRLVSLFDEQIEISKPDTSDLYRVKVGPISDLATAENITQKLEEIGIKPNKTYGG